MNPESKASNAGLRDGDLILSVNGEQVQVPSTTNATFSSSVGSNSSQNQPPAQDQHHKISSLLHGDRVRLSVLSKKSKIAKKLQKALAKGEFDQQQGVQVQWADGKTCGKMRDDGTDNANESQNLENGCLDQEDEEKVQQRSQLGQGKVKIKNVLVYAFRHIIITKHLSCEKVSTSTTCLFYLKKRDNGNSRVFCVTPSNFV